MQRILPTSPAQALFDVALTRLIEQRASAALPPHTLMRRAGLATARLALAIAPHANRIWIAAGPGNNGGDGLEAALHLRQWGKAVDVSLLATSHCFPMMQSMRSRERKQQVFRSIRRHSMRMKRRTSRSMPCSASAQAVLRMLRWRI